MAVIIIRIQVIELRRFGNTVCNSTRFCAFDGIDQDSGLAAYCKGADTSLRRFVISRKNFLQIDTVASAEASAILFSLSETARANNLQPYEYFKYLLEEMPKHMMDDHRDMSFLDDLLPWSETLPAKIRKPVV